jgi:hypothetical protein
MVVEVCGWIGENTPLDNQEKPAGPIPSHPIRKTNQARRPAAHCLRCGGRAREGLRAAAGARTRYFLEKRAAGNPRQRDAFPSHFFDFENSNLAEAGGNVAVLSDSITE